MAIMPSPEPGSCPHTCPAQVARLCLAALPARASSGGSGGSEPPRRQGTVWGCCRWPALQSLARAAVPPYPGPEPPGAAGDPRGAIPTLGRAGARPCAPGPGPQGLAEPAEPWVVEQSHVSAAAVARQQWKMAKNVGLGLTRLEPAGPGLQALSPQRGN